MPPLPRTLLVSFLLFEILCADLLRWPLTNATAGSALEFQVAQEVIASENWRRDGALARHFVPSRSIDQTLPEWTARDLYWRDYISLPPLSFMLLHFTSRLFPFVEPILLGKLLAQVQIAIAVPLAAIFLYEVFGFGATLGGLSFLIWGRPFLVWFIDGYFGTTPAVLCQLVLVAWSLAFFQRELCGEAAEGPARVRWSDLGMAVSLAFLGAFSEWVALFGNGVAVMAFLVVGAALTIGRVPAARKAFVLALSMAIGSAIAVLTTVLLYGTKLGFAFYWGGFTDRIETRTGPGGSFVHHTNVILTQMRTAWSGTTLFVLGLMLLLVLAYVMASFAKRTRQPGRPALLLLALVLGYGSGVVYCYGLKNLIEIHWWFTGTIVVGLVMTVCTCASVIREWIDGLGSARWRPIAQSAATVVLVAGGITMNLSFVQASEWRSTSDGSTPDEIYRSLGRDLPRDGAPLIVADLPHLFAHYPFTTAYLRRPVVRYVPDPRPRPRLDPQLLAGLETNLVMFIVTADAPGWALSPLGFALDEPFAASSTLRLYVRVRERPLPKERPWLYLYRDGDPTILDFPARPTPDLSGAQPGDTVVMAFPLQLQPGLYQAYTGSSVAENAIVPIGWIVVGRPRSKEFGAAVESMRARGNEARADEVMLAVDRVAIDGLAPQAKVMFAGPGELFKLETAEDARPALLARGDFAYVVYNPRVRRCAYELVPLRNWHRTASLNVCRVPMLDLVRDPARVFP